MLERERDFALDIVRRAAEICRSVQNEIDPGQLDKKDRSPVTVADFAVQALVSGLLAEQFPEDPLVGEEGADQLREASAAPVRQQVIEQVRRCRANDVSEKTVLDWIDRGQATGGAAGRFWVLDPIDGTKGFLRKEQYAIALALIENGRVVLGVLGCPNLPAQMTTGAEQGDGYLFFAVRGGGAFAVALDGDCEPAAVHVAAADGPASQRRCESVESGHAAHSEMAQIAELAQLTAEPLRLDSQAKYAIVARGEAAAYLRLSPDATYTEKIWDHAAGAIVIEEAGGVVTDLLGKPLDFSCGRKLSANRGIIAAIPSLHAQVVQATAQVVGL